MRLLSINHQPDAGPGVFAEAIAGAGARLEEWHIAETPAPPVAPGGYDAVMSFGGSMDVDQEDRYPWLVDEKALLQELLAAGTPFLGVCLGAQLLSEAAGGNAHRLARPEIGWFEVEVCAEGVRDPLLGALAPHFEGFEWHSWGCGAPDHAIVLARTPACTQAFRIGESAWGIQFHAEVTATNAEAWIDEHKSEPEAKRLGIDPEALRAQTMPRMAAWNSLGRELCGRFLAAVQARRGVGAQST
jgi:GMP synthase-like glutamine amidotransferase